jgi:DoxX-like family
MQARRIAFWTSTGILVFVLVSGGIGELLHLWGTLDTATVLGYPPYFLTIIGAWKILGALVLLLPGIPRLKEWAYAGIVFNMTGAAASHAFAADYGPFAFHVLVTLALAGLALASWALQPRGTRSRPLTARLRATSQPV